MHKTLSALAFVFSVVGALFIAYMFLGMAAGSFESGNGMALLVFQIWGAIAAIIGFILTSVVFFIARSNKEPMPRPASLARWISLGTLAALIAGFALT